MALPSRADRAGWYAEGPRPGQPGPAVVIGHVDWDHSPAVFFHLHDLRPGDPVYVDRADRSTARFRVIGLSQVPKSRFPTDRVFAPTLEPSLRLVTCGGSFDRATGNYRDNVIVFAVPT
jgi:sortase (surface protein transpeptidase)